MAERSSDQYVGFLVPLQESTADVWEDQSSYQQDGPQPGNITPASRSRLRLSATGTQDTTSYVVTARRGGHIAPSGAGFTWRKSTDATTQERGWDPPTLLHGFQPVAWSAAALLVSHHPDRAVLPDGTMLVSASVQTTLSHVVRTWTVAGDGSVTGPVTVYTQSATPSTRVSSHLAPSVAVLDDGSVILGHLVEDTTAQEAQWRVYRSTDSGASWTEVATLALPSPIDTDTSTSGDGYQIVRCRMRHNRGYTLLLIECVRNNTGGTDRYAYLQYASTADATRFELVEENSEGTLGAGNAKRFGACDAWTYRGGFMVSYPDGTDLLDVSFLADAYEPLSGAETVSHEPSETVSTIAAGNYYSDGNTSVWEAPDGSVYLTWRDVGGSSACRIARANGLDGSAPFSTLGEGTGTGGGGAAWWSANTSGTYPAHFVGCAALGRNNIFGLVEATTTTTYEGSLVHLLLGGWSTVTMPGLDALAPETRRAGWTHTGVPFELPGNTVWTKVASGTHTTGLASGVLQADASGSTLHWSVVPTAAPSETVIAEVAVVINSGTVATTAMNAGLRLRIDDGAEGHEVQVRIGINPDRIVMYDGVSGAQIGDAANVDWSNTYEIRLEKAGHDAQAWYRVQDQASDREWTELAETGALTDNGGAAGSNVLRWGPALTSQTIQSDWTAWHYLNGDDNEGRSLPLTNPDDLFARDFAGLGRGVYVEGLLVTATGGPARQGDSFTLAPQYDAQRGALDNALYGVATPRRTWRTPPISPVSGSITEQTIAYQTGPSGEESYPLSEIMGLHVSRPTFTTGAIQRKDTSSGWVNVSAFDLVVDTTFTGTRYGDTVRPTSGTSGRWVDRDELRDGWLRMGNSSPYTWRKIRANTPGLLAAPSSGLATVIQFDDADGTEPTGSVGMAVLAPDVTVLVHTAGETAEGWRVKIDAQNAAGGTAEAGCLWLGYVVVPGKRWELGDRTATVPGTERQEGIDRVDHARELAPDRRELEVGWTATNVVAKLMGGTAAPDHALASELSGARPVAAPDASPGDVVGLIRRCRGALVPVVALSRIIKLSGSTNLQTIWRRDEQVRAYFSGPVSVRHVTGDEGSPLDGLAYRVESVPLTEIV